MPPHVEVVIGVLLDAAEAVQLGQQVDQEPEVLDEPDAGDRVCARDQAAQLVEGPLSGHRPDERRGSLGQDGGVRLNLEPQLGRKSSQAQHTQRVVLECAVGHSPQQALAEIRLSTARVDERREVIQRARHRVDREVPQLEIGLDRVAAQGRDVRLPRAIPCDHAPSPEPLGEREHVRPGRVGQPVRIGAGLLTDDYVHVRVDRPAEKRVPYGAADQPGRPAGERGARDSHDGRALEGRDGVRQGPAPGPVMRGTRGEIPHVTS